MPSHTLHSEIITLLNRINSLAYLATYVEAKYEIEKIDHYYKLIEIDADEERNSSIAMKGVKFKYYLEGFLYAQSIYAV